MCIQFKRDGVNVALNFVIVTENLAVQMHLNLIDTRYCTLFNLVNDAKLLRPTNNIIFQ